MIKDINKFTERARHVLHVALEDARSRNQQYIGTVHILAGLIGEGEGVGVKVLVNLGIDLSKAAIWTASCIKHADYPDNLKSELVLSTSDPKGDLTLSPRAKNVIELAVDEARRLNHHYIGTQHLLLGLLREGEGVAARVLESMGVTLEKAREATAKVLNKKGERRTMFTVKEERKYTITFEGESIGILRKVCAFADKRLISGIESLPPEEEEQIRTFIIEFLDKTKG